MKKCPECNSYFDNNTFQTCTNCGEPLEDVGTGQPQNTPDSSQKPIKEVDPMAKVFLLFCVVVIISGLLVLCGGPSQYESDYDSMLNKTYDQMTDSEKSIFEDKLDWELGND